MTTATATTKSTTTKPDLYSYEFIGRTPSGTAVMVLSPRGQVIYLSSSCEIACNLDTPVSN